METRAAVLLLLLGAVVPMTTAYPYQHLRNMRSRRIPNPRQLYQNQDMLIRGRRGKGPDDREVSYLGQSQMDSAASSSSSSSSSNYGGFRDQGPPLQPVDVDPNADRAFQQAGGPYQRQQQPLQPIQPNILQQQADSFAPNPKQLGLEPVRSDSGPPSVLSQQPAAPVRQQQQQPEAPSDPDAPCDPSSCVEPENCLNVTRTGSCCPTCAQYGCLCVGYHQMYDCRQNGYGEGKVPAGESYSVDSGSTVCQCPVGGGMISCSFRDAFSGGPEPFGPVGGAPKLVCPAMPVYCIETSSRPDGCSMCLAVGCVEDDGTKHRAGLTVNRPLCSVCYCPSEGGNLMCSDDRACMERNNDDTLHTSQALHATQRVMRDPIQREAELGDSPAAKAPPAQQAPQAPTQFGNGGSDELGYDTTYLQADWNKFNSGASKPQSPQRSVAAPDSATKEVENAPVAPIANPRSPGRFADDSGAFRGYDFQSPTNQNANSRFAGDTGAFRPYDNRGTEGFYNPQVYRDTYQNRYRYGYDFPRQPQYNFGDERGPLYTGVNNQDSASSRNALPEDPAKPMEPAKGGQATDGQQESKTESDDSSNREANTGKKGGAGLYPNTGFYNDYVQRPRNEYQLFQPLPNYRYHPYDTPSSYYANPNFLAKPKLPIGGDASAAAGNEAPNAGAKDPNSPNAKSTSDESVPLQPNAKYNNNRDGSVHLPVNTAVNQGVNQPSSVGGTGNTIGQSFNPYNPNAAGVGRDSSPDSSKYNPNSVEQPVVVPNQYPAAPPGSQYYTRNTNQLYRNNQLYPDPQQPYRPFNPAGDLNRRGTLVVPDRFEGDLGRPVAPNSVGDAGANNNGVYKSKRLENDLVRPKLQEPGIDGVQPGAEAAKLADSGVQPAPAKSASDDIDVEVEQSETSDSSQEPDSGPNRPENLDADKTMDSSLGQREFPTLNQQARPHTGPQPTPVGFPNYPLPYPQQLMSQSGYPDPSNPQYNPYDRQAIFYNRARGPPYPPFQYNLAGNRGMWNALGVYPSRVPYATSQGTNVNGTSAIENRDPRLPVHPPLHNVVPSIVPLRSSTLYAPAMPLIVPTSDMTSFENVLSACCVEGKKWILQHDSCTGIPVTVETYGQICAVAQEKCCMQAMNEESCQLGIETARSMAACEVQPNLNGQCETEGFKPCCDCCALGLKAFGLSLSCNMQILGEACNRAYSECCRKGMLVGNGDAQGAQSIPLLRPSASSPTLASTTQINGVDNSVLCPTDLRCEHHCVKSPTGVKCACRIGYHLEDDQSTCADTNECVIGTHTCKEGQFCFNTVGSFKCQRRISCGTGYELTDKNTCNDIDECDLDLHDCSPNLDCMNIRGSYRCVPKTCDPGYITDATGGCNDIDECRGGDFFCPPHSRCVNTPGSYSCSCQEGLVFNDHHQRCDDIDECDLGISNCQEGSTCINTVGSFTCRDPPKLTCPPGYEPQDDHCADIDECAEGTSTCGEGSTCINEIGSFRCQDPIVCPQGTRPSRNQRSCVDVNECEESPDRCGPGGECVNLPGSYRCECRRGYRQGGNVTDGVETCEDINECHRRPCNHKCLNTPGSYTCICPQGYRLNGKACEDLDECGVGGINNCTAAETCFNTRGGFKCENLQCPANYARIAKRNRCVRNLCRNAANRRECIRKPKQVSFHNITVANGAHAGKAIFRFSFIQSSAKDRYYFLLTKGNVDGSFRVEKRRKRKRQIGVVYTDKTMSGPRDYVVDLTLKLYRRRRWTSFVSRLYIYVAQYRF